MPATMPDQMKGYLGIGVERISKPMNIGNLFRSAHALRASFPFAGEADKSRLEARSDTSAAPDRLPSCRHPKRAAYPFGPERGALSPAPLPGPVHDARSMSGQ